MAIEVISPLKEAYPHHKWYTSGQGYVLSDTSDDRLGFMDLTPMHPEHQNLVGNSLGDWEHAIMMQLSRLDVVLQYALVEINTNSLIVRGRPKVAYISVKIPLNESKPAVVTIDSTSGDKEEYTQYH